VQHRERYATVNFLLVPTSISNRTYRPSRASLSHFCSLKHIKDLLLVVTVRLRADQWRGKATVWRSLLSVE